LGKEDPFKLSNVKYLCKIRLALKFEPPRGCGYLYIYIIYSAHIEYGIEILASQGIPIIELETGYLEYS
jgi:hypothetical protein